MGRHAEDTRHVALIHGGWTVFTEDGRFELEMIAAMSKAYEVSLKELHDTGQPELNVRACRAVPSGTAPRRRRTRPLQSNIGTPVG